jgi:hypothetical protein
LTGISLPLLAFRHRIKRASDGAWHALCAQKYAQRWWATINESDLPKDISQYPGDRKTPFGSIKISPSQFSKSGETFDRVHIENAIISITGAFEAYMADVIGRCLLVNPELLSDSEMPFKTSELVTPEALSSPLTWIAGQYVQRSVRSKSHSELIRRFGSMVKRDVPKTNPVDYDAWNRFVMLRNALVHAAGLVTGDLVRLWGTRFHSPRTLIVVEPTDLKLVHKAAYGLANTIDAFAVDRVIKKSDADLLAREIFVLTGKTDSGEISRTIAHLLNERFSKNQVEASLAKQRREQLDTSKEFLIRVEWLHRPHEIYT